MITLATGVNGHGRNIVTQDLAASAARSAHGLTLFVLAHPDDELAFAPLLHRLAHAQRPVRLLYLTDGAAPFASTALRNAESAAALAWLGIGRSSLWFVGSEFGIADGQLYRHLYPALDAIDQRVPADTAIAAIYTLAWEGGHPDHDAAHVVAAAFAAARGLDDRLWQVAFYRAADRLPAPMFVVGAPLAANGPVQSSPLAPAERRLARRMMRFYRSQWRSLVGLGPFIVWHSLTRRTFTWQAVSYARLAERPTPRPLLYEVRNGVAFDDFRAQSAPFLAAPRTPRPAIAAEFA